MKTLKVGYVDYYIPQNKKSIETYLNSLSDNHLPVVFEDKEEYSEFIEEVLNQEEIRIEGELEPIEMMQKLLDDFLGSNLLTSEEVDLVIIAKESDKVRKNIAHQLIFDNKLTNALPLSISGYQCANVEAAIQYCNKMMSAGGIKNVLVLSYLKAQVDEHRIIGTYALESDGAGLLWLSTTTKNPLLTFEDGLLLNNPSLYAANKINDYSLIHCKYYTKALKNMFDGEVIKETIQKVIIQNANTSLLQQCLNAYDLEEKIFDSGVSFGHTDCLDVIINLKKYINSKHEGKVLCFGVGWLGGYSILIFNK